MSCCDSDSYPLLYTFSKQKVRNTDTCYFPVVLRVIFFFTFQHILQIPLFTLAGHRETVTRICWLPSTLTNDNEIKPGGNQLLSISWDHSLRIWDCEAAKGNTGAEVRCILSNHALHDADVNSRGILTASSDNCIRIFDPRAEGKLYYIT